MTTITSLNQRLGYRLSKVIYFIITIVIIVECVISAYEESIYYPTDYTKTRITCAGSNIQIDENKKKYSIRDELTADQKMLIAQDICGIKTKIPITENYNKYPDLLLSSNDIFLASKGVMIKEIKLLKFLGLIISILAGMGIVTETLRRLIYYIILGSFKPEK